MDATEDTHVNWLLVAWLALALLLVAACGGGQPAVLSPVSAAAASPVTLEGAPFPQSANPISCTTLHQPCLSVGRVVDQGGGAPGTVANSLIVRSIVGPAVTNFEWAGLFLLDNHAAAGENVALYAQGNARNGGSTWAGVFEAIDKGAAAQPNLLGIEVNLGVVRPHNGNQFGVHSVAHAREGARAGAGGTAAFVADGGSSQWASALRAQGQVGVILDAARVTTAAPVFAALPPGVLVGGAPGVKYAGKLPVIVGDRTLYLHLYE